MRNKKGLIRELLIGPAILTAQDVLPSEVEPQPPEPAHVPISGEALRAQMRNARRVARLAQKGY